MDNRHDNLAPKMSSIILANHVKQGIELGTPVQAASAHYRDHTATPRHRTDEVLLLQGAAGG
jgi:hypothetical protein